MHLTNGELDALVTRRADELAEVGDMGGLAELVCILGENVGHALEHLSGLHRLEADR